MNIETLVVTVDCESCVELYKKMNIKGNAVIGNQCGHTGTEYLTYNGNQIKCIADKRRGLSLNRSVTISESQGDILVTAEDDVVYHDDYIDIILKAYRDFPTADAILFDVRSTNTNRPSFERPSSKILALHEILRFAAFQITYKRVIIDENIVPDKMFGPGGTHFIHAAGEDTIFLADIYRKKHKIAYVKKEIGIVTHAESSWIKFEWSPEFFRDRGAVFTAVSKKLAVPFILYFTIKNIPVYRHKTSFFRAVSEMLKGRKMYLKITKEQKQRG